MKIYMFTIYLLIFTVRKTIVLTAVYTDTQVTLSYEITARLEGMHHDEGKCKLNRIQGSFRRNLFNTLTTCTPSIQPSISSTTLNRIHSSKKKNNRKRLSTALYDTILFNYTIIPIITIKDDCDLKKLQNQKYNVKENAKSPGIWNWNWSWNWKNQQPIDKTIKEYLQDIKISPSNLNTRMLLSSGRKPNKRSTNNNNVIQSIIPILISSLLKANEEINNTTNLTNPINMNWLNSSYDLNNKLSYPKLPNNDNEIRSLGVEKTTYIYNTNVMEVNENDVQNKWNWEWTWKW